MEMKQKPLKLDDKGRLKVDEVETAKAILDFLRAEGWDCLRTPASRIRYPSGQWGWIFEEGHADYICTRPIEPRRSSRVAIEFFYLETKAPDARTHKERLDKQREFAEAKTLRGYLCYRAPEGEHDQFEVFLEWYNRYFYQWRGNNAGRQ
jgi:hypothetical protein